MKSTIFSVAALAALSSAAPLTKRQFQNGNTFPLNDGMFLPISLHTILFIH